MWNYNLLNGVLFYVALKLFSFTFGIESEKLFQSRYYSVFVQNSNLQSFDTSGLIGILFVLLNSFLIIS